MKRLATRFDRLSEDTARAYLEEAIAAVEAALSASAAETKVQPQHARQRELGGCNDDGYRPAG